MQPVRRFNELGHFCFGDLYYRFSFVANHLQAHISKSKMKKAFFFASLSRVLRSLENLIQIQCQQNKQHPGVVKWDV